MIEKILIKNFKIFKSFRLECRDNLNLIVGDNDTGKSTILEAVLLTLSRRLNGRAADSELSPFLFNKSCVDEYILLLQAGENAPLPEIEVDIFLSSSPGFKKYKGSNNLEKANAIGIRVVISLDAACASDYQALLEREKSTIKTIPIEYYAVQWLSFANEILTPREMPMSVSFIDASTIRLQSGTDYYLQDIVRNHLSERDRNNLAVAFRGLKERFSEEESIKGINTELTQTKGAISDRQLTISLDSSQRTSWEANLIPHLDSVPFPFIGKGEQNALKIMLALTRKAAASNVILIEEPENHLSFSSMNILVRKIREKCADKQVFVTTHSAYVLNKLGIENTALICESNALFLSDLSRDTHEYFKKLSGYDTLRLILAKKAILVEGPSDELIVQKAYLLRHGRLPIEDGVDVINVRGLSFKRFLEIAKPLQIPTVVVTDNDGDYTRNVDVRYAEYKGCAHIRICASADDSAKTLEPQIVACNEITTLNKILDTEHTNMETLLAYMATNKTECALAIFTTGEDVTMPAYIKDAVN